MPSTKTKPAAKKATPKAKAAQRRKAAPAQVKAAEIDFSTQQGPDFEVEPGHEGVFAADVATNKGAFEQGVFEAEAEAEAAVAAKAVVASDEEAHQVEIAKARSAEAIHVSEAADQDAADAAELEKLQADIATGKDPRPISPRPFTEGSPTV